MHVPAGNKKERFGGMLSLVGHLGTCVP